MDRRSSKQNEVQLPERSVIRDENQLRWTGDAFILVGQAFMYAFRSMLPETIQKDFHHKGIARTCEGSEGTDRFH